jgi:hypothetical protein
MNLSIKVAFLFLISTQNFITRADLDLDLTSTTVATLIGLTSITAITAYISGAQKKALRKKGHKISNPTEQIIPHTPGAERWNSINTAAKISTVTTGLLALGTSLNTISNIYKFCMFSGNYEREIKRIFATSFFCTTLFSVSTIASYYLHTYAANKSKKFTQEYIAANPEAYKEQIARNRSYIAERDALIIDTIDKNVALFDLEIHRVDSLAPTHN